MKETFSSKFRNWLFDNLKNSHFKVNDKLPTETQLIKLFNVSKMTIRKEISSLVSEGILFSVQGDAVYISNKIYDLGELDLPLIYQNFDNIEVKLLDASSTQPNIPKELFVIEKQKLTWESYVKLYFEKSTNNLIAYTVNFINQNFPTEKTEILKLQKKSTKTHFHFDNYVRKNLYTVIKTNNDMWFKDLKNDFLIKLNTTTYYKNKLVMFQDTKINPNYFKLKE